MKKEGKKSEHKRDEKKDVISTEKGNDTEKEDIIIPEKISVITTPEKTSFLNKKIFFIFGIIALIIIVSLIVYFMIKSSSNSSNIPAPVIDGIKLNSVYITGSKNSIVISMFRNTEKEITDMKIVFKLKNGTSYNYTIAKSQYPEFNKSKEYEISSIWVNGLKDFSDINSLTLFYIVGNNEVYETNFENIEIKPVQSKKNQTLNITKVTSTGGGGGGGGGGGSPNPSCTSNCNEKVCGNDGCGGSCGTCRVGYDCLNNICINSSANCTDYYEGDYFNKDYVYLRNGSIFWDKCIDSINLTEYYCSCYDNICGVKDKTPDCALGCNDGACKDPSNGILIIQDFGALELIDVVNEKKCNILNEANCQVWKAIHNSTIGGVDSISAFVEIHDKEIDRENLSDVLQEKALLENWSYGEENFFSYPVFILYKERNGTYDYIISWIYNEKIIGINIAGWNFSVLDDDDFEEMIYYYLFKYPASVSCIDSDGLDYYNSGNVSSGSSTNFDYCYSDGKTLNEYYCGESNQTYSENYECSYQCRDGACVNLTIMITSSVATLKDSYNINEVINLTDPPDEIKINSIPVASDIIPEDIVNIPETFNGSYDSPSGKRYNVENGKIIEKQSNYRGYIIQFKNPPLLEEKRIIEREEGKFSTLSDYKSELESEHSLALKDIQSKLTGGELPSLNFWQQIIEFFKKIFLSENHTLSGDILKFIGNKLKISGYAVSEQQALAPENEYFNVFNGISLNITDKEAEIIKQSPYVKEVYKNLEVHANLMDSVPLIKANYFWGIDSDGNNCTISGNECLTGKNTTIGIIDTGIDYSHPDLGNCSFPKPEEDETCFTPVNITIEQCIDSDGGLNYCHKGTVRIGPYGWYDYCMGNTLVERYCLSNGSIGEIKYECPETCENGACSKIVNINTMGCSKVIGGFDFINYDNNPIDDQGHGTHVAGIAAGTGIGGLKGVAPDAKLYAYKVLNYGGSGSWSNVIAGIERAVDPNQDKDFSDHLDVISLSLGGTGNPDDPVSIAIDNAVNGGVVAVIAAGNDGPWNNTIGSPGTARNAITVGATDKSDLIARFSSRGPVYWNNTYLNKPDIVAPGYLICSAEYDNAWSSSKCLDNKHVAISGTSMATPHVAGAVALLKQANKNLNPYEVKSLLKSNAINLGYAINEQGSGRLNLSLKNINNPPLYAQLEIHEDSNNSILNLYPRIYGNRQISKITFDYKKVSESNWTIISESSVMPESISFDYSILRTGKYMIRLSVKDSSGEISSDSLNFDVDMFSVYYPWSDLTGIGYLPMVFRNGDIIDIRGNVNKLDGNYRLEGVKVRCPGNSEVNAGEFTGNRKGIIATVNTSFISGKTICEFEIDYYYNDLLLENESINISFEPSLYPGYPVRFGIDWDQISRIPTIADLDHDGNPEVIFVREREMNRNPARVIIMDINGNKKYPDLELPIASPGIPAIADIDNDKKDEIIFREYSSPNTGYVYVINYDNTIKQGWPKPHNYLSFDADIIADDINNDGDIELITSDIDSDSFPVTVLDKNGNELPGWPVYLDKCLGGGSDTLSHISVANMDDDLEKEIIVKQTRVESQYSMYEDTGIYVLDTNGSMLSGWPVILYNESVNSAHQVIGDINKDGKNEIIFSTYNRTAQNSNIYVYNNKGARLSQTKIDRLATGLVADDIDSDGNIEIIAIEIYKDLVVFDSNLNEKARSYDYFPRDLSFSPVIYRDKNNKKVMVVTDAVSIQSFNYNGTVNLINKKDAQFWTRPMPVIYNISSGVLVFSTTDLTMSNPALAKYWYSKELTNRIDLYAWFINNSKVLPEDPITYAYNNQRTGCYNCSKARIQSKISNNFNESLSGNLILRLEKYENLQWNIVKEVNRSIIIPASGYIKLDTGKDNLDNQVFGGWNNLNFKADSSGRYRVYIIFETNGKLYDREWEFSVG